MQIISAVVFLFFTFVFAEDTPLDIQLQSIEQLEKQLFKNPAKKIKAFQRITEAFSKKNYGSVIREASRLESNPDFLDYYHFLIGQAEYSRMREAHLKKRWANVLFSGTQAVYHFSKIQSANPYTPLNKRALSLWGETELLLGEASLRLKQKNKAMQFYENGFQHLSQAHLLSLVPKRVIVDYALLCEGKLQKKIPEDTSVCTSWELKLAPFIAKTDEARQLEKIAAFKNPVNGVATSTTSVPYKIDLDLQAFSAGFQQYLAGRYVDAYIAFRNLLAQFPRTSIKFRTKFWMARSAQKSNHHLQAETIYREILRDLPFSYFGLLSSWFSGISLARVMHSELPQGVINTALLSPTDVVHMRRAETLIASGAPELAQYELSEVVAREYMSNEFLVYLTLLNHLAGNHVAVFRITNELNNREFRGFFSSYGQKILFPISVLPNVRRLVSTAPDQLLVLSVIKQESAFYSEAISVSNAYGLMQIIRPTARELDPKIEVLDLFQPETNIRLGALYLQQLLARYKGNLMLALSAYNAGPSNAERWQREAPSGLPPEEFIELIGFRETREYVQNILRNLFWYHRRINGETLENLQSLLDFGSGIVRTPASRKVAKSRSKVIFKKTLNIKSKK